MNELEKDVQMALSNAAAFVSLKPDVKMNLLDRLFETSNPNKRYIHKKRVAVVALLVSLVLVVGTAYAETISNQIKLLLKIEDIPVFSKPTSGAQKLDALQEVRTANRVNRDKVEAMSPVAFIFPKLPEGYQLAEEYGIPGTVAYDKKTKKAWLLRDGSFSYTAIFEKEMNFPNKREESRIVVAYSFDAAFSTYSGVELRGPEAATITIKGIPVIETDALSEAWLKYPNGGLMKIGISTPESITAEERRESLKSILGNLDLPN